MIQHQHTFTAWGTTHLSLPLFGRPFAQFSACCFICKRNFRTVEAVFVSFRWAFRWWLKFCFFFLHLASNSCKASWNKNLTEERSQSKENIKFIHKWFSWLPALCRHETAQKFVKRNAFFPVVALSASVENRLENHCSTKKPREEKKEKFCVVRVGCERKANASKKKATQKTIVFGRFGLLEVFSVVCWKFVWEAAAKMVSGNKMVS